MKGFIFKMKYRFYKKEALLFYEKLILSQKKSKGELERNSVKAFIKMFDFAIENSPFYKAKYESVGLVKGSIRTKVDIEKVPFLTKQEVKENPEAFLTVSKKDKELGKGSTGGSTGVPMLYYSDRSIPYESFSWRYLSWWDNKPWDNGAFIWRMIKKSKISILLNNLAWWPVIKIKMDASIMDYNKMMLFSKKINSLKPKLIQGYVGAVYQFAYYLKVNDIKVHSPNSIWVTSAPISVYQRKIIEEVFDCPVYDEYGASEVPWIAAQCSEKKHLHVNVEGRYLEIVNKNSQGEGDIVITNLLNFKFPLIRYELGDRTKFINEACSCGINLPLISRVKGRVGDFIEVPNLGKIDASYLTTIFDEYPNSINAFQILQKKNSDIILKVVPNESYKNSIKEINIVKVRLENVVKDNVEVKLEFYDALNSDRGKTRYIIKE